MGNCYSIDHISEDHTHTDITCNIEEPQKNYCLAQYDIFRASGKADIRSDIQPHSLFQRFS